MKFLQLFLLILVLSVQAQITFVRQPALTQSSGKYWVEFELSGSTDVAVSIIDLRDSSVVRHLAGGVLGSNPPAPLTANSLSQKIEWDGKDDLGYPVPNPAIMAVRIRAGMGINLERWVGENLHSFTSGLSVTGGGVFGMVMNDSGSVFIYGCPGPVTQLHWKTPYKNVRQFDKDGNYVSTAYPFPAGLNYGAVEGWGVVPYPTAGLYTPIHTNTSVPGYSKTLLATLESKRNRILFIGKDGRIAVGDAIAYTRFGQDGSKEDTNTSERFIINPPLPPRDELSGETMVTLLPGGDKALVSGICHKINGVEQSSGTYIDGRVFKVDLATGQTSVFLDQGKVITGDSARTSVLLGGVDYRQIHGTAVDAAGRIYVCDRVNKRIGIYDSNALLLGQILLPAADQVKISKRTGAIYATTRYQLKTGSETGHVRLFKFASFESGAGLLCSLTVYSKVHDSPWPAYLTVNDASAKTRVWVAYVSTSVRIYEDDGNAFSLYRDFNNNAVNEVHGFDRVHIDRRTETVYFNDNWYGIYKIEDWNNPQIVPCSTNSGQRIHAGDLTISPHHLLYLRVNNRFTGPIRRYSLDHYHAPTPFDNTGDNLQAPYIRGSAGGSAGDKGLAVDSKGKTAAVNIVTFGTHIAFFADSGRGDTLGDVKALFELGQLGCLKFDSKDNIYFGAVAFDPNRRLPSAFADDIFYPRVTGSVFRYPNHFADDTVTFSRTAAPVGAQPDKTYSCGVGPFSREIGGSSGNCSCRTPRFDVDPYGRLFLPNGMGCEVNVVDNNDNMILRFGRYGNSDSRGSGSDIPLAFTTSVAASEDYIYVTDLANCRMARIRMLYELDNHPEIHGSSAEKGNQPALTNITIRPNPFNPTCQVSLSLNQTSRVRLDVFDAAGRFIKTVACDYLTAGKYSYQWNGVDRSGRSVAAGVYYLRVTAGLKERFVKMVFAR